MGKLQLSDSIGQEDVTGQVILDDDIGPFTEVDTTGRMTILTRTVVGRTPDGDRVFDWTQFATDVPVIAYEDRTEVEDGIELVKIRVVALYQGDDLPSTMAIRFEYGTNGSKELPVFRVNDVFQNGVRLEIQGERVL